MTSDTRRHAIVLGASVAGLLTARVLSSHYERVTVIERDRLPDSAAQRKGVPQGQHAHGLLVRGKQIVEQLFPGIGEALVASGAVALDMGSEVRYHHFGGYKTSFRSGVIALLQSRPLLEAEVRRRLKARANVELRDATRALRLVVEDGRVRGVVVAPADDEARADEETLSADVVVDATGRGSASPKWLEELGCGAVQESEIRVDVGYATRMFERGPDDLGGGIKSTLVLATPPTSRRLAAILPLEGNRWMVTLGGWMRDYPPIDEEGYTAFARSLPARDAVDLVTKAKPLGDAVQFRVPSNLRRHYERVRNLPLGFLVTGDALASFNPVYGQGMTVAALEALALDGVLAAGTERDRLARRFYAAVSPIVDGAWALAGSEDFRFEGVTGPRPSGATFLQWYTARVHRAATRDPVVLGAFIQAMNMLAPPTVLFRPDVLRRVLTKGGAAR